MLGANDYIVTGDLTIRGVKRKVALKTTYLGQWETPWWEDAVDKGPKTRAGFTATTQIDRHDSGASGNSALPLSGIGDQLIGMAVGNIVEMTLDAEAILDDGRPPLIGDRPLSVAS